MLLINYIGSVPQYRWLLYEINISTEIEEPILLIIFGIVEVLILINLIRFNLEINRLKKERDIQE